MCDSAAEHRPSSHRSEDVQTRTPPSVSRSGLPNIGEFIEQHTYKCFFVGTPLLIIGSFLYYTPMHNEMMNLIYTSLMLIFIGGIFVWIPIFHWMTETTDQTDSQVGQPACEPRMKPPDYDSLIPPGPGDMVGAPPAYDEIFHVSEHSQRLNTISSIVTTNVETMAPVHQHQSHGLGSGIPYSPTSESQTGSSRDLHESDIQPLLATN